MADMDGIKTNNHEGIDPSKNFHTEVAPGKTNYHIKGMDNMSWGMKDRMSRIFNPKSGNALILAVDHGYISGATKGLERLDILLPELQEDIDVVMATRGAIRTCLPPMFNKPIALRCSAGSTVLSEDVTSETIGVDIEDVIRMNASAMAVQTFLGTKDEKETITNLCRTIDAGIKYGIPTLAVLATRVLAELGAQIVKTYYCEDFEKVTSGCPVPIVVAGGKQLPPKEALTLAYRAISEGARGVDMGRNIFQAEDPKAMAKAVAKVIHEKYTDNEAYEFYLDTKVK